ncbi:MAG: alpha/beta hydrolase [Polaromonas sp.]|nr:alpha/beta hydrolase [Polaromonas sp.]MDP3752519.1 alpha/beta hydrolase [Polaromonas sp.]
MSWVLLRGLTREARHWGLFPGQLSAALGTDPAVLLDLPGNGMFHRQPSATSVSAMVEFARGQLRAQGLQPPWNLLAMSLGAMVATDWAQRYPHEVVRLVLINTSMRPFSRVTERLRPGPGLQTWRTLVRLAWYWGEIDPAERLIHQLTCNRGAEREDDLAAWRRIRQSAPVSAANAWRQLWAAARFSAAATAPACPTLLLSASGDGLVHPQCSQAVASAWQASHQTHPWAGHDLPHDDADWVCQRIAQWLVKR